MNALARRLATARLASKPVSQLCRPGIGADPDAAAHASDLAARFHTSGALRTAATTDSGAQLHEFGKYVMSCLPKYIQRVSVVKDELTLYVAPTAVPSVMTFLRDNTNCQYKQCIVGLYLPSGRRDDSDGRDLRTSAGSTTPLAQTASKLCTTCLACATTPASVLKPTAMSSLRFPR